MKSRKYSSGSNTFLLMQVLMMNLTYPLFEVHNKLGSVSSETTRRR